jgi:hypothetical protein
MIGSIAFCQHDHLGYIERQTDDGIWKGFHLSEEKYGQPWQSKRPRIVARPENVEDYIKNFTDYNHIHLKDLTVNSNEQ